MDKNQSWFENFRQSKHFGILQQKPLAYFCIEYALSDFLPTYAGGLGVLAGDFIKELADQKIPSVAVGLYYQSKYGAIDIPEHQFIPLSPEEQGLQPVLDKNNKPLLITVPIQDHDIFVRAWKWQNKSIPLYLLDTDVVENNTQDKSIGFKLYDSNKETRLKQEMVLGIAGFRLLEMLHFEPSIVHMNEGHSALLLLEIIRHEMQKHKVGFTDALELASRHVVFTNHTLLAAGNEIYSNDLFTLMLERYASELEVPVSEIAALGEIKGSDSFSMALFALRLAGKINAVSRLHAQEAKKTWVDFSAVAVTNGIHIPSWDTVLDTNLLIQKHKENKNNLISYIREETGNPWNENEMIIGWARRMVRYKRPLALFENIQRLVKMIKSTTPFRIVLSGIAHQGDSQGRELVQMLEQLIQVEFPDRAVYLPNYSVGLAKILTTGCDVWLNTPVIGSEACGTSGMKACLNGVLPVSTRDGWMDEVDIPEIGWSVDSDTIQDSLLDTLEDEVLPSFYLDDRKKWERLMKNGRNLIFEQYSATRMLKDYFEKIYIPILDSSASHFFS